MDAQGAQPAVSWDDFRVFLQVARTGKITAAAQFLSLDYTTVGRRVRTLEDGLGVVLFEKSKARGYELTAEGQRLLVHAEAMEQALDAVRREVQAESESVAGHVRLGTTEGFGTFVLAPQLSALQRRCGAPSPRWNMGFPLLRAAGTRAIIGQSGSSSP